MTPLARWKSLRSRRPEPEWMDEPDVDPAKLTDALRFIRRINALLGYTASTIGHLKRLAAVWPTERPMTILDVATGSGDVPRAILRTWPNRRLKIIGLDLHAATIRAAAAGGAGGAGGPAGATVTGKVDPRLQWIRGDATALPLADRSIDFVISGMFLHHLGDDLTIAVLREMDRVARHGIVIADLLRSRRAYAWITLFTLPSSRMIRHDARTSVAAAYTVVELQSLVARAGIRPLTSHRHFGHRVVFAG